MIDIPKEIEESTAITWFVQGTIRITSKGEENTYYADDFGNTFYCKNYPDKMSNFAGWHLFGHRP